MSAMKTPKEIIIESEASEALPGGSGREAACARLRCIRIILEGCLLLLAAWVHFADKALNFLRTGSGGTMEDARIAIDSWPSLMAAVIPVSLACAAATWSVRRRGSI